jgi:hypothetical protein
MLVAWAVTKFRLSVLIVKQESTLKCLLCKNMHQYGGICMSIQTEFRNLSFNCIKSHWKISVFSGYVTLYKFVTNIRLKIFI